jgi:hypothetical protein
VRKVVFNLAFPFSIGIIFAVEIYSQFTYKDNFDAGFNAVMMSIFFFFILLNDFMHEDIIKIYKKIQKLDNEMIAALSSSATRAIQAGNKACDLMYKIKVQAESETERANTAEKALYDFKADLAKKEMKKRKTPKKTVKKVAKKKK